MSIENMARTVAKHVLPERIKSALRFLIRKKLVYVTRPRFSFSNPPEKSPESPFPFSVSKKENPLEELGEKYLPSEVAPFV